MRKGRREKKGKEEKRRKELIILGQRVRIEIETTRRIQEPRYRIKIARISSPMQGSLAHEIGEDDGGLVQLGEVVQHLYVFA